MNMPENCILLEMGDVLVLHNDISHAGAENLIENTNYRINTFVRIKDWSNLNWDSKYNIKKVRDVNVKGMAWGINVLKCISK